jgi:hypothetical protein
LATGLLGLDQVDARRSGDNSVTAALCVKPRGQMMPQQIASVDALMIESAEFTIMCQFDSVVC